MTFIPFPQSKSSALQTKLKLIRHMQDQYKSKHQVLRRLKHQGETLGKQVRTQVVAVSICGRMVEGLWSIGVEPWLC